VTVSFEEPIIHLDMDAFFVEVERLTRRELLGRPVAVGGTGPRSVVASASYEARRAGVHSAMPMAQARRLCPTLVIVPPDHGRYGEYSRRVFRVLESFTPMVEAVSVDEAFLDVSGLRLHFSNPVEVAEAIRGEIRSAVDLPASAGVGPNKLIAKLASREAKPDGVAAVRAGDVEAFLRSLPVRRLWGVGEATHASLERLGVRTIGDLADVPRNVLARTVGASLGAQLFDLARGIDDRTVAPAGGAKSHSVEQTYPTDISDPATLETELLRHSEELSFRLRRAGQAGRTVMIKVRFSDFATVARSRTLDSPTDVARDIFASARRLLAQVPTAGRRVRLLGVGVSSLTDHGAPRQLSVDRSPAWDEVSDAVGRIRDRFGVEAVGPARLARGPEDKVD
jgi:DNA polymerase-4